MEVNRSRSIKKVARRYNYEPRGKKEGVNSGGSEDFRVDAPISTYSTDAIGILNIETKWRETRSPIYRSKDASTQNSGDDNLGKYRTDSSSWTSDILNANEMIPVSLKRGNKNNVKIKSHLPKKAKWVDTESNADANNAMPVKTCRRGSKKKMLGSASVEEEAETILGKRGRKKRSFEFPIEEAKRKLQKKGRMTREIVKKKCGTKKTRGHFACEHCGKKSQWFSDYKRHSLVHEDTANFICSLCEKRFKHSKSLYLHMKAKHVSPGIALRDESVSTRNKDNDETLATSEGAASTVVAKNGKNLNCSENCNASANPQKNNQDTSEGLNKNGKREIKNLSENERNANDDLSKNEERGVENLNKKGKETPENGKRETEDLSEGAINNLENLLAKSDGIRKKNLKCEICWKQFIWHSAWKRHVESHTCGKRAKLLKKPRDAKKDRFCCSYCGRGFRFRSDWVRHEARHENKLSQKAFACDICGMRFKFIFRMFKHKRQRHYGEEVSSDEDDFLMGKEGEIYREPSLDTTKESSVANGQFSAINDNEERGITRDILECQVCTEMPVTAHQAKVSASTQSEDVIQIRKKRGRPRKTRDANGITELRCHICGHVCESKMSLSTHKSLVHGIIIRRGRPPKNSTGNPTQDSCKKCKVCGKKFLRPSDRKRHEITHKKNKPYKCNLCDKYLRSENTLVLHIMRRHPDINEADFESAISFLVDQKYLPKVLPDGEMLKEEQLPETSLAETTPCKLDAKKCDICGKVLSHMQCLIAHKVRIHAGVRDLGNTPSLCDPNKSKDLDCSVCSKIFDRPGDRERHETVTHGLMRSFPCDICGKCLKHESGLIAHKLRAHSGDVARFNESNEHSTIDEIDNAKVRKKEEKESSVKAGTDLRTLISGNLENDFVKENESDANEYWEDSADNDRVFEYSGISNSRKEQRKITPKNDRHSTNHFENELEIARSGDTCGQIHVSGTSVGQINLEALVRTEWDTNVISKYICSDQNDVKGAIHREKNSKWSKMQFGGNIGAGVSAHANTKDDEIMTQRNKPTSDCLENQTNGIIDGNRGDIQMQYVVRSIANVVSRSRNQDEIIEGKYDVTSVSHVDSKQSSQVSSSSNVAVANKRAVRKCEICRMKFDSLPSFRSHLNGHFRELQSCNVCKRKFDLLDELEEHLKAHLRDARDCPICGLKFIRPEILEQHVNEHHVRELRSCDICGCNFDSLIELERHLEAHVISAHRCVCGSQFLRVEDLKRHMKNEDHTEINCGICDEIFFETNLLVEHLLTHGLVTANPRSQCDKIFTSERYLRMRETKRAKAEPFGCTICGMKFARTEDLEYHATMHLNRDEGGDVWEEIVNNASLDRQLDGADGSRLPNYVQIAQMFENFWVDDESSASD